MSSNGVTTTRQDAYDSSVDESNVSGRSRASRQAEREKRRAERETLAASSGYSEADLEKRMVESLKKLTPKFVEDLVPALVPAIQKPTATMVSGLVGEELKAVHSRIAKVEQGQERIAREVKEVKGGLQDLSESVADIKRIVLEKSKSTPNLVQPNAASPDFGGDDALGINDATLPKFWRKPDPTLLLADTLGRKDVSKEAFNASFDKLADEANITPDMFEIHGEPLGNRFQIKFGG